MIAPYRNFNAPKIYKITVHLKAWSDCRAAKTALRSHNLELWSHRLFTECDSESPRSKFEEGHGQTDDRKWPNILRWRRRGQYYVTGARRQETMAAKLVLNSTGRGWFTTAGRVRTDSGWSWILCIAHVTLHNCEVAPRTLQTLSSAHFSPSVWPSSHSNFNLRSSPTDSSEKS